MTRYALSRLLQVVPLVVGITLVTFVVVNLVPGSPIANIEEQLGRNRGVRQEDVDRIKRNLGLDQPVHVRYVTWAGNVLRGDFGISLRNYRPVSELLLERMPNTLLLTSSALILSLAIAIPTGIYAAVRRGRTFDHASTAVAVACYSLPTFWLALMLILLVAVKFRDWGLPSLPAGGATDARGGGMLDRLEHLILPAFALALVNTAYWVQFVRSSMLEVLNQDYVRTARAKGIRERWVVGRHCLRNALAPLMTLLGLTLPELFAGSLIVEQIFTYPGMGQLAFTAAMNKDYPLIMGGVMFAALLVIAGNLIADLSYRLLDPRVSIAG